MEENLVETSEGMIPFDELTIEERTTNGANDVKVEREWFYQGRLVRRDVWVTLLRIG